MDAWEYSHAKIRYIYRMKIRLLLIVCLAFLKVNAQLAHRLTLLSNWNNPNLPKVDSFNIWNDLMGYHDSATGKEYIIAGSTDSIYFFDISDPAKITLCDVEYGANRQMINRDYVTYQHYAYCVSDNKNPGALQIFDLKFLPDSVHKVFESDTFGRNTHTLFVDAPSKRLYMGINRFVNYTAAMDILSLENPEQPVFLARLQVPNDITGQPVFKNVHEMYVRNDTAYCSVEYAGLFMFDLRNLNNQHLIGTISNYPKNGYNHSSWLDRTGKRIMFTDEVPTGLEIKIFDITDPGNPRLQSMFNSHAGATPHNAYWVGDFAYVSSYEDGVYVYDLGDPKHPFAVAWYDTYPQNAAGSYNGYLGCWGVWPFLPSGNIIASDRSNGIFVLKPDSGLLKTDEVARPMDMCIFPNPAKEKLYVRFSGIAAEAPYMIVAANGQKVLEGKCGKQGLHEVDIRSLSPGFYFITLQNGGQTMHQKFVVE